MSHRQLLRRRTPLVIGAVVLLFGIATFGPAAAPGFTGWSTPVNLGPTINTTATEGAPALSRNGLSLYFRSNRPGGYGGDDIWVSQRASVGGAWGTPVNLGPTVNSALSETVPAFSRDGHWMFFASDRPGGFGLADIWSSWRPQTNDDFGWEAPTNLGPHVNTALNDNGSSYFESDGGAPQLFFVSSRPGGLGDADLYVSELQADGSWGPATWLPELNSTALDVRPTVRDDGLEIFFSSNRAGGVGALDVWGATRDTVNSPWSTPVDLDTTVNSSVDDNQPYLAAGGRTLIFGSSRPGTFGGLDLYMTTRAAKLTVTANDETRLFGQANPSLSYAISGFVGGETAAVVSGTAACSTTATPFSPAGAYPITCTVGSLGAPGYVFETFVAGTLTVAYTSPCLTGPHAGPLTVLAGQAACIGAGGVQTGPITVAPGGALDVEGGQITGPLTATGAAAVRICGAAVTGPLTISGSGGLVLVGGDAATGPCDANTVIGPVSVTSNTGGVEVNGNFVVGPLRITGNTGTLPPPDTGSVHAVGNAVIGPVTIQP